MMILSLSTMLRVQISSTVNEEHSIQARQNALLGLSVALGQLQAQMGPDQRVSASAELIKSGDSPGIPEIASNDLRRHWLGAWDASENAYADTDTSSMLWVNAPNAAHLSWLVSGVEDTVGAVPSTVFNLDEKGIPLADSGLAIMAGGKSVGDGNLEDFVYAPIVDIPTDPGRSLSSGAYAYWISDEAQKAPLNLVDARYVDVSVSSKSRSDLMAPERVGIETVSGWKEYDLKNGDLARSLNRLMYLSDINLVEQGYWADAIPDYFHDFGMGATMLQTDVRNGGLKKDLNLLFELSDENFNGSPYGGNPDAERVDNPETDVGYLDPYEGGAVSYLFKHPVPDISANAYLRGPTWHFLRSYYNLYKDVSGADAAPSIASRAYRPNTIDYANAAGYNHDFAMRYSFVNVMGSANKGNSDADIDPWDNFVNTKVKPIKEWEIRSGPVDVPRLTGHEVAPVAVRMYLVFSLAQVSLNHVYRIARDELGEPLLATYIDENGETQESEDGWIMEDSGPGNIIALKVQPVAVLWNPYNVSISFNAYKLKFTNPKMAFSFSWRDVGSLTTEGSYTATFNDLMKSAVPVHHLVDGQVINRNLDYFEFLFGNPPDGDDPIILQPGEQRIFSAAEELSMADVRASDKPLFMEPGWNTNGGILMYRSELDSRHRMTQRAKKNPDDVPPAVEIDNISAEYEVSVDDVYWVSKYSNFASDRAANDERIILFDWQDYLLTDKNSIKEGGDFLKEDFALRAMGGGYSTPSGENPSDVFKDIKNNRILPLDFVNGTCPFMYMEVRINPANTDLGVSVEMLGNSNPFALLGSSMFSGDVVTDRYGVFMGPMSGFADYNNLRPQTFLNDTRTYFGYGYGVDVGSRSVILQEIPTMPLWSLGSLQHANISSSGYMPRNAIGNSQATPFVPSDELDLNFKMQWGIMQPTMYDVSYLSNEVLFDSYFFSSLAPASEELTVSQRLDSIVEVAEDTGVDPVLSNRRFAYFGDDDYSKLRSDLIGNDGYTKSAAYWAPEGGFNINSTSVVAWKAFLAGNFGREFDYYDGTSIRSDTSVGALYSRVSLPNAEVGSSGNIKDDWNAPISLTDSQLDALAVAIVDEVKARGPFLSLSDFVNRRPGSSDVNQQRQGALARAIDQSGINNEIGEAGDDAYDWVSDARFNVDNTLGRTSAGIPGWLTQADVLTPLAPYISARSDTFIIRAYGEATTGIEGDVASRAWCEALVQRVPEYMDPTGNDPWAEVSDLVDGGINETFGRRFKIIGFRWLSKDDV
ncbi:hypothetical protein [Cerasicoccus arenae]